MAFKIESGINSENIKKLKELRIYMEKYGMKR